MTSMIYHEYKLEYNCTSRLNQFKKNVHVAQEKNSSKKKKKSQYTYSPYCSLYISLGAVKENLLSNQELF